MTATGDAHTMKRQQKNYDARQPRFKIITRANHDSKILHAPTTSQNYYYAYYTQGGENTKGTYEWRIFYTNDQQQQNTPINNQSKSDLRNEWSYIEGMHKRILFEQLQDKRKRATR